MQTLYRHRFPKGSVMKLMATIWKQTLHLVDENPLYYPTTLRQGKTSFQRPITKLATFTFTLPFNVTLVPVALGILVCQECQVSNVKKSTTGLR